MYHATDTLENRVGSQDLTRYDLTQAPVSYPVGTGGPTFHGYRSDDDPAYPGPE